MINTNLFTFKTAILKTAMIFILAAIFYTFFNHGAHSGSLTTLATIFELTTIIWYRKNVGPLHQPGNYWGLSFEKNQMNSFTHNDEREWQNMLRAAIFSYRLFFLLIGLLILILAALVLFHNLPSPTVLALILSYLLLSLLIYTWSYYFSYRYYDQKY